MCAPRKEIANQNKYLIIVFLYYGTRLLYIHKFIDRKRVKDQMNM